MKKTIISLSALALLASMAPAPVMAQEAAPAAKPAATEHKAPVKRHVRKTHKRVVHKKKMEHKKVEKKEMKKVEKK